MSTIYTRSSSRIQTPQSQPIPGTDQVQNEAGGWNYRLPPMKFLERFLILGTEGGTYYVDESKLTRESTATVEQVIRDRGLDAVAVIEAVSRAGRAPRSAPATWALAAASVFGDLDTRRAAAQALPSVCRTGTHLFQWVDAVINLGSHSFGRVRRKAVANWYQCRTQESLIYQITKYRNRGGWTHRDLLRLAHVKPRHPIQDAIFAWVCGKVTEDRQAHLPDALVAFDLLQSTDDLDTVLELIKEWEFTHEMIPTKWLSSSRVWTRLLENNMPMGAMVRNLGRMTANGTLLPFNDALSLVVDALTNRQRVIGARLHPVSILQALETYRSGIGLRGSLTWTPLARVLSALESAFHHSFGSIAPSGKRVLLAVDHSGSMQWSSCHGLQGVTPAQAGAAMMMATAAIEPNHHIIGFGTSVTTPPIGPNNSLNEAMKHFGRGEGTDCALPFRYAEARGIQVDVFVLYTDEQTWAGDSHASQALNHYRDSTGINSKAVSVVMQSSKGSTILDPSDPGSLNVAGFDASVPSAISEFVSM